MEKRYYFALTAMVSLFFLWGFLTSLNDILIPQLKSHFNLSYLQAMLIQFAFFTAYGVLSIPSGKLLDLLGYHKSLVLGLIVIGCGALLFWPAAAFASYPMFLSALFILAGGIVLLQVSANPYIALLGDEKSASGRLNLAQAFNSLGTTVAPQVGALLILTVATTPLDASIKEIETFYGGLALATFLIAIIFAFIRLPQIRSESYDTFERHLSDFGARKESINPEALISSEKAFGYRHLILGAIAIFLYVGAEVTIGSFLVNFLSSADVLGIDRVRSGQYVSFYWGCAMVGRFIGFSLLLKFTARRLLGLSAIANVILLLFTIFGAAPWIGYTILSIGLFNSIMFPTIFTLAIAGLGRLTAQGSGILCTAIIGGALVPLVSGFLADHVGIQRALFIPLLCYFYILYFALRGSIPSYRFSN